MEVVEKSFDSNADELFFNPYNSLNKEITLNDVQYILKRYGVSATPYNLKLYLIM